MGIDDLDHSVGIDDLSEVRRVLITVAYIDEENTEKNSTNAGRTSELRTQLVGAEGTGRRGGKISVKSIYEYQVWVSEKKNAPLAKNKMLLTKQDIYRIIYSIRSMSCRKDTDERREGKGRNVYITRKQKNTDVEKKSLKGKTKTQTQEKKKVGR